MANVIVVFRVMPEGPDVDLVSLENLLKEEVGRLGGKVGKVEKEPIAFGLNALKLMVVADESKGTDELEKGLAEVEGVRSAEAIDVRRAIG